MRGVEIGSSCFGHTDPATGAFVPARLELLRLAVPRRVYTDNHLEYVAAALARLYKRRDSIGGLRRTYATPLLSHFTARFEPAAGGAGAGGILLLPARGGVDGGAAGAINGEAAAAETNANGCAAAADGTAAANGDGCHAANGCH